ncbi:hypothetical protein TIFTF001_051808 [Ficus carica]|uniref:Uncharacterized protein n=1 Tax=Ficus carica TaxID=3494 RepID=A0AA88JGC1_FICCA|nr:hypothetical protein TIFTF001_051808 [Ficus carica]
MFSPFFTDLFSLSFPFLSLSLSLSLSSAHSLSPLISRCRCCLSLPPLAITVLGLIILGVMIGDAIWAAAIVISASRRFFLGFSAATTAGYCM